VREGLFRRERFVQLDLQRHLDTLKDLRAWLDEFTQLADLPPHDWLIERVQRALRAGRSRAKIVVRGPLGMRVLAKVGK
jgi:hypothetical protein